MGSDTENALDADVPAASELDEIQEYELIEARPFYTPKQVGELIQITRRHIYRLIDDGDLVGHQIGSAWRISHADLMAFLAKRRRSKKNNSQLMSFES